MTEYEKFIQNKTQLGGEFARRRVALVGLPLQGPADDRQRVVRQRRGVALEHVEPHVEHPVEKLRRRPRTRHANSCRAPEVPQLPALHA